MELNREVDPQLAAIIAVLQAVPSRNQDRARLGRAAFLQQAKEMAAAVTPTQKSRHNGWMHALPSISVIRRKEKSPMFSSLPTILFLVTLVFGGSGATLAAAQVSQPDQPFYGVKVMSEDVRLALSTDPQSEYQLTLEFSNRRAKELQAMLQAGRTPPEVVQSRYQNQVDQAIQFALALPDHQAILALEQIRTRLQIQHQALLQVQTNGSPQAEAALIQSRQMVQARLQWVEAGLLNPTQLRDQLRQHDQQRKQDNPISATPVEPSPKASSGTGSANSWITGTPTPGSGYGPGPGTGVCENCTPTVSQPGGNPWTTGTPTPGSGYGPGPGPDPAPTCTTGSGVGLGPQPTQQQKNQPTQAGPEPSQGSQQTSAGPGPQPETPPGGPGGKH